MPMNREGGGVTIKHQNSDTEGPRNEDARIEDRGCEERGKLTVSTLSEDSHTVGSFQFTLPTMFLAQWALFSLHYSGATGRRLDRNFLGHIGQRYT